MKTKPICILFFSILSIFCFGQKKDSISLKSKWKYQTNFMVGFDVLNAGLSPFTDKKLFPGFVSTRLNKNIHAIVDAGFEKNKYQKNGYDASASGAFVKLGSFYMLVTDGENDFNGFYAGGKLGASFYHQEYQKIPIRGYAGNNASVAFSSSTQSSYWLEANVGGRVQLFKSNFYIDINAQPRYLLFSTKQEDIQPMIVPGFGKSSNKFNLGISWHLAYKF